MNIKIRSILFSLFWSPLIYAENITIWDTHLHYNAFDSQILKPETIIQKLKSNHIEKAVVTSNPPLLVQTLKNHDPSLILPLLGVYEGKTHKNNWLSDSNVPKRLSENLKTGQWVGIGEIHLFGHQRYSPVFKQVLLIASEKQLPLLIHCDPVVIDQAFEIDPGLRIIWAHAGKYPYPPLLKDYLNRYPNLVIDLSVREDLIATDGRLKAEWETLFVEYSDRFFVGVDTYSLNRWMNLKKTTDKIRGYLNLLPEDTKQPLAFKNAQNFFNLRK